jgi:CRP-like cAMP-binding protein
MSKESIFNEVKEWEPFKDLFEEIEFPAKTTLLREGKISRKAYYILDGCLRLWFNDHGKDVTFQFFFEGNGVSSVESFRNNRPSLFTLESIEPCTILTISKEKFQSIVDSSSEIKNQIEEQIFERMIHYQKLFLSRIKDSPKERYLTLINDNPKLLQRVPQHYIASYLGITPVSLSRIRSQLSS